MTTSMPAVRPAGQPQQSRPAGTVLLMFYLFIYKKKINSGEESPLNAIVRDYKRQRYIATEKIAISNSLSTAIMYLDLGL